jgi:hypothetical protein
MQHLPPAHHEISKRNSPNETKIREKQNETIPDSNSNLTNSMAHHNQTKELTTWFLKNPWQSLPTFTRALATAAVIQQVVDKCHNGQHTQQRLFSYRTTNKWP